MGASVEPEQQTEKRQDSSHSPSFQITYKQPRIDIKYDNNFVYLITIYNMHTRVRHPSIATFEGGTRRNRRGRWMDNYKIAKLSL